MKNLVRHIIYITFLLVIVSCYHTEKPVPVCRIENNKVVFRLDNRWDHNHIKEISFTYNLDTLILQKAFESRKEFTNNGEVWKIKKINSHFIDLSKPLENMTDTLISNGYVVMITNRARGDQFKGFLPENYGINILFRENAFKYTDGKASFWLPGYPEADNVILSGTFNNWSTSEKVMTQCDSGWTTTIKLNPGKYPYKYIIDGNWTPDPINSLKEDDLNGGFNSVVYCHNHLFKITGRKEADEIRLTGDFLNWNPTGITMQRTPAGWELPIYLKEGTYLYKFISGNDWFTDPGNPDMQNDGSDNFNSVITIGEKHIFKLLGFTNATRVTVSGTFNSWEEEKPEMVKDNTGWSLSCAFPAGNYEYKFIVDGKWMIDPSNENTTGSGELVNSLLCFKPNHTFSLEKYQDAKEVMVTGSFNGFSNPGYRMSRREGRWVLPVYLKPGKTIYKFIVDGEWILDPANELWEDNEYGTGNSVIWIEQPQ